MLLFRDPSIRPTWIRAMTSTFMGTHVCVSFNKLDKVWPI